MRIKFLKPVPAADGTTHKVDSFLTVDNETVAKQYVELGYAEEAPEVGDVAGQVKSAVAEMFGAFTAEIKAAAKSSGPAVRVDSVTRPEDEAPHEDDKPELRQKKFGKWLQCVGIAENPHSFSNDQRVKAINTLHERYKSAKNSWSDKEIVRGDVKAANIEGSGPAGGYTVPPEFSNDIWRIAIEASLLASRAKKRPMTSNEFRYPKLDQTGTQATGQTGYLGGVVARWSKETAARTETEPKLKQGVMKAGELTGYSVISNELLQDNASGLAALITELFGEANSYYMDLATLVGDGIDKPVGVLNASATIPFNRVGGAGTQTLAFSDFTNMVQRLFPGSKGSAIWIANQTLTTPIWTLADTAGHLIFQPSYSGTAGPAAVAPPERILNIPVFYTEKTPVYGTAGDLMLVDPLGYMVGDRMGLEIAASPHVNFLNNEMTYRFVSRMAGQPLLDKPFTMLDGTNKLSHFVALN